MKQNITKYWETDCIIMSALTLNCVSVYQEFLAIFECLLIEQCKSFIIYHFDSVIVCKLRQLERCRYLKYYIVGSNLALVLQNYDYFLQEWWKDDVWVMDYDREQFRYWKLPNPKRR